MNLEPCGHDTRDPSGICASCRIEREYEAMLKEIQERGEGTDADESEGHYGVPLRYMELCQNVVPLIWFAYRSGYSIQPLKTDIERERDEAGIGG